MNSEFPHEHLHNAKKNGIRKIYSDFAPFLTMGFQLAAAVVVSFLVGHWIDKKYNIEPIGKLVGILVGSVGGFIKFFKSVASLAADKEKRKNLKNEN